MTIRDKLELLVDQIESKGGSIRPHLRPPLSREEIVSKLSALPFSLPEEIIELYTWHDGVEDDCQVPLFRDNQFLSLDAAMQEYEMMCQYYADAEDRVDLRKCFPFAGFDGAVYVLPSLKQALKPELQCPVISVFEGVEVFFLDILTMLDTCTEWYVQGIHNPVTLEVDDSRESSLWREKNPGVFD